ncbi:FAD-dependent oxidoreductase [Oxynema aestuarii AP17]|uniref:FAD-dependent oxidoreductase n=1 Tax=Oxynema aestuarii AP17 TaxID=2064643 RepID=A0A6H1U441_9CYAN|nr:FAD-dependent oxidoreductase [Oxynema aestuarii AP17]RMH77187.1 MAG: FAD-dependent oxidoreductase [Cyanobacteria bacterium J007]
MVTDNERYYDIITFGDEVPGVLAAIAAAREYRRRTETYPKVLLMSKADAREGIGGHLVRGGLAYLDRSQIEIDLRKSLNLGTFGAPPSLYEEFLKKAGVVSIALDPHKADAALKTMLKEAGVAILSNVEIESATCDNGPLVEIVTARGEIYKAKQFIDATVNAELAQAAGVTKYNGFATFGLPDSELPVTLVFVTEGLSVKRLKQVEYAYLKRLTNNNDREAQRFIDIAARSESGLVEVLKRDLVDSRGQLKTLWAGKDHIDVRSNALSIVYHACRGKKLDLEESGSLLDRGNIAILGGDRLSWNALLFTVTGSEAETLARNCAKPTPAMLEEMSYVERWFKSIGAKTVTPASELYIRHAGNVVGVVEPLSGAQMLAGGVPADEAIGTFAYHFDVRGGIRGIGRKANEKGFLSTVFDKPIFNIGIRHAQIKAVPNLAVVSPASGFEGFASSAGRIVEFNAAVGQGIGIAATLAVLQNRHLAEIGNREVHETLSTTGQLPPIFGKPKEQEVARLRDFESALA